MLNGGRNNSYHCDECGDDFDDLEEFRIHAAMEEKRQTFDCSHEWKFRKLPKTYSNATVKLCEEFKIYRRCSLGDNCPQPHGHDEYSEWLRRWKIKRDFETTCANEALYGIPLRKQLYNEYKKSEDPRSIMREKIQDVEGRVNRPLQDTLDTLECQTWIFSLISRRSLKAVTIMTDREASEFFIGRVFVSSGGKEMFNRMYPRNHREWSTYLEMEGQECEYEVYINFKSDQYGSFSQKIVFDFDHKKPYLVKEISVEIVRPNDRNPVDVICEKLVSPSKTRWDGTNCKILRLNSENLLLDKFPNKFSVELLDRYPEPNPANFKVQHNTIKEETFTLANYKLRMHQMLYIEEIAQFEAISKFNVEMPILFQHILEEQDNTIRVAQEGELYGTLHFEEGVTEDRMSGRIITENCNTIFLARAESFEQAARGGARAKVYEVAIVSKYRYQVFLKVPKEAVDGLGIKQDETALLCVQFQMNRLPYCEYHHSIDEMTNLKNVFPNLESQHNIWSLEPSEDIEIADVLNQEQQDAVRSIVRYRGKNLPPVLIIGPYGTGKTYTLYYAIMKLLEYEGSKILICTHSNSAADLYITNYLDKNVAEGWHAATPLRVIYEKRRVATINEVVLKYCTVEEVDGQRVFRKPTMAEINEHRIIICTLNMSIHLAQLGVKKGYFTHILLDEAAQALEFEAIMPLTLANDTTRVVLAGDHMQISPTVQSQFAKQHKMEQSLLERLYNYYDKRHCGDNIGRKLKIMLTKNYRSHEAIVKFTSEQFYRNNLVCMGNAPRYANHYPLTFVAAYGPESRDESSSGFFNNSEVNAVVKVVEELYKSWNPRWGSFDNEMGIVAPYLDQVRRIRQELRKINHRNITVERVQNIQGKEFKIIVISTVRTRATCKPEIVQSKTELNFGFLSDVKLLNTALTRAQSLIVAVGEPLSLCSIGDCRKSWDKFLEICDANGSLYGISYWELRQKLNGIELQREYILNPKVAEFVPNFHMNRGILEQFLGQGVNTLPSPLSLPPPPPLSLPPPSPASEDYTLAPYVRSRNVSDFVGAPLGGGNNYPRPPPPPSFIDTSMSYSDLWEYFKALSMGMPCPAQNYLPIPHQMRPQPMPYLIPTMHAGNAAHTQAQGSQVTVQNPTQPIPYLIPTMHAGNAAHTQSQGSQVTVQNPPQPIPYLIPTMHTGNAVHTQAQGSQFRVQDPPQPISHLIPTMHVGNAAHAQAHGSQVTVQNPPQPISHLIPTMHVGNAAHAQAHGSQVTVQNPPQPIPYLIPTMHAGNAAHAQAHGSQVTVQNPPQPISHLIPTMHVGNAAHAQAQGSLVTVQNPPQPISHLIPTMHVSNAAHAQAQGRQVTVQNLPQLIPYLIPTTHAGNVSQAEGSQVTVQNPPSLPLPPLACGIQDNVRAQRSSQNANESSQAARVIQTRGGFHQQESSIQSPNNQGLSHQNYSSFGGASSFDDKISHEAASGTNYQGAAVGGTQAAGFQNCPSQALDAMRVMHATFGTMGASFQGSGFHQPVQSFPNSNSRATTTSLPPPGLYTQLRCDNHQVVAVPTATAIAASSAIFDNSPQSYGIRPMALPQNMAPIFYNNNNNNNRHHFQPNFMQQRSNYQQQRQQPLTNQQISPPTNIPPLFLPPPSQYDRS